MLVGQAGLWGDHVPALCFGSPSQAGCPSCHWGRRACPLGVLWCCSCWDCQWQSLVGGTWLAKGWLAPLHWAGQGRAPPWLWSNAWCRHHTPAPELPAVDPSRHAPCCEFAGAARGSLLQLERARPPTGTTSTSGQANKLCFETRVRSHTSQCRPWTLARRQHRHDQAGRQAAVAALAGIIIRQAGCSGKHHQRDPATPETPTGCSAQHPPPQSAAEVGAWGPGGAAREPPVIR